MRGGDTAVDEKGAEEEEEDDDDDEEEAVSRCLFTIEEGLVEKVLVDTTGKSCPSTRVFPSFLPLINASFASAATGDPSFKVVEESAGEPEAFRS